MSFEFNVRMGEKGFGFTLSVDGITMAQVDQVATMIENVLTSKKDDIARVLKEGADKINEAVEKAKKAEDKTGTDDSEGYRRSYFRDYRDGYPNGMTPRYSMDYRKMDYRKEGGFDEKIHKDKDDTEGGEEDMNTVKEEAGEHTEHIIAGKKFVVSGNCMYFKSKKALEEYILKHGGIIQEAVSNDTNYVISSYSNTYACASAREKGIPVYNERQFRFNFYQYIDINEYLKKSFIFSNNDCIKSF